MFYALADLSYLRYSGPDRPASGKYKKSPEENKKDSGMKNPLSGT